jgi:hypothetical protein
VPSVDALKLPDRSLDAGCFRSLFLGGFGGDLFCRFLQCRRAQRFVAVYGIRIDLDV